jgi:adenosine deaminase
MSNTSLTDEFDLACEHFGLGLRDVERLSVNAMKSAFVPYGERVRIIYDVIKPRFARLRDETNPHD